MMKLSKLFGTALLVGTLMVVGCGDDGGGGATGTGGTTGGTDDPSALCNQGVCAGNEDAKALCINDINECLLLDEARQDECIAFALLDKCEVQI